MMTKILSMFGPVVFSLSATLALVALMGCDQECKPEESQCFGNSAELCDGDGEWYTVMDCDELGPNWDCVYLADEDIHTCMPISDGGV